MKIIFSIVLFGSDPGVEPIPKTIAFCNECSWKGDPRELISTFWEHYRYCPKCGSDDTDLREDDTDNSKIKNGKLK